MLSNTLIAERQGSQACSSPSRSARSLRNELAKKFFTWNFRRSKNSSLVTYKRMGLTTSGRPSQSLISRAAFSDNSYNNPNLYSKLCSRFPIPLHDMPMHTHA